MRNIYLILVGVMLGAAGAGWMFPYVPVKTVEVAPVYTVVGDNFPSFIAHTTAYTAGPESTGKSPGHPAYGITASGTHVKEGKTIAMSKDFPFGTLVMIEGFNEVFEVQDRGGAIKGNNLDIYMEDLEQAIKHGRQDLRVWIIKWGE